MKKLSILLFAVVLVSLAAAPASAVPPLCGYVCFEPGNELCYCELTCRISTCDSCQVGVLGLTGATDWMGESAPPAWMADATSGTTDVQAALEPTPAMAVGPESEMPTSDE